MKVRTFNASATADTPFAGRVLFAAIRHLHDRLSVNPAGLVQLVPDPVDSDDLHAMGSRITELPAEVLDVSVDRPV